MKAHVYLNMFTTDGCLGDEHAYKIKISKKGFKALKKLSEAVNKRCFDKPTNPTLGVYRNPRKAEK